MTTAALPVDQLIVSLDELQLAQLPVYADPAEHVRDELQRLALLFELRGLILKKRGVLQGNDRFRGLLLRDGELSQLLKNAATLPADADDDPEIRSAQTFFEQKTREIVLKEAATLWSYHRGNGGCRLPLIDVARRFGLTAFQRQLLLLALAPEVDLSFQRMFSYLLNDVTRKRPNVHLALELFGTDDATRREGRRAFLPNSPLLDLNLIEMEAPTSGMETSLLLRDFKMPERMVLWLMGADGVAPDMQRYAQLTLGPDHFDDLIYTERDQRRLAALKAYIQRLNDGPPQPTPLVVLTGQPGAGKRSVSQRLAAAIRRPLLIVNLEATAIPPNQRDRAYRDLAREARLHGAALCLANFRDELVSGGLVPPLGYLLSILRLAPGLGVLTSASADISLSDVSGGFSTRIALSIPDTFGRIKLWETLILRTGKNTHEDVDLRSFALKYGFTGGAIIRVLEQAHQEAMMRIGSADAPVHSTDLDMACRIQLGKGLGSIASRVNQVANLQEMVLPEEIRGTIQEIIGQARYRSVVFHDWGFDRKMVSGKGLSILFSGPPGTGKTMVAGCIAGELGMDLFKVDLSQVVSKYVGETEKNLKTVFDAAQGNQFIILFDEADSLFAKRTEVKSSVDRYANLEVNYLLQKIEEYGGMCILTTNFEKGIDDAFKRRLNFRVEFPFPEKEDRIHLWQKMIPIEAPLAEELDFDWIAEKYELAGGNIKNAVLRAAFWAAQHERSLTLEDFELAAEKESREIGKLVQGAGY